MPARRLRSWSLVAACAVVAALAIGAGAAYQHARPAEDASRLAEPGGWHSTLQATLRPDVDRLESALSTNNASAARLLPLLVFLAGGLALLGRRRSSSAPLTWITSPWLARARHGMGRRAPPASALA